MLAPYVRILRVPGALLFSLTGLVARIPISTVSLGIVLLVAAQTDSYGLAGTVSAVYVLANAALAVVHGRLADRWGQAAALFPAAVVFGVGGGALVLSILLGAPPALVYATAALAGAALPQAGSCVRARWGHALRGDPSGVETAFAFEAVVDEAVFICGPIAVTFLAAAVHPAAGLATAVVVGVLGMLALAAQRGTQPPVLRAHGVGAKEPHRWAVLAPASAAAAGLGCVFGATEVATVAFAGERDAAAWAGVVLALWALGSLSAGVVVGAIRWRSGPLSRLRVGAIALSVTMAPVLLIDSVPLLGLAMLIAGAAISPTLIGLMSLIQQSAPPQRVTEAMAIVHTGMAVGIAPGAALAGLAADLGGARTSFVVPVAAGLVAVVCSWLVRRPDRCAPTHIAAV